MRALLVTPGEADSTEVAEVADPRPSAGELLLRTLAVGVCGTDREISEGLFGVAPDGESRLVLGHEFLGVVERDAHGFSRGELVSATVRRSCGHCRPCAEGSPDACETGDYSERGITRRHGYASELVAESPEHMVPVPPSLRGLGVLAEPASICARGIRHARAIGERQPWGPQRALVVGTGAIGMLSTYFLRLEGFDVWLAGRSRGGNEKSQLAEACGATYVSTEETPATDLAQDVGGFDLVIEAAGDAQVMLDSLRLLARNGVACLLGIDGHPRDVSIDGRVLGVDAILQNRALFGSVNAHRVDWLAGVEHLDRARARWPDAMEQFVGLRVGLDSFRVAFDFRGVKATLAFADG